jgi:hypothetical protein
VKVLSRREHTVPVRAAVVARVVECGAQRMRCSRRSREMRVTKQALPLS